MSVLVLNQTYVPLSIVSIKRSIRLLVLGKAEVVHETNESWKTITKEIKIPSVIRLLKFVKTKIKRAYNKITRRFVFIRDGYTCQYCGRKPSSDSLTIDHIIPRSQGGKTWWDNVVACCSPCNRLKGNKTPNEADMHLLSRPRIPSHLEISLGFTHLTEISKQDWERYISPHIKGMK